MRRREMTEGLLEDTKEGYEQTVGKARLVRGSLRSRKLETCSRVVCNGEAMEKGTNRRFVVTTRNDEPKALYKYYARHGKGEHRIQDFKVHIKMSRLSCHRVMTNQSLLLHTAAYQLMDALRNKLIEGDFWRM